jgi:D-aspartate ligase
VNQLDTSAPALVLHLHHGALGVARSLGRLGIRVHGMGFDPDGAASSSRYFREIVPWNFETEPPERSAEELMRIGRAMGEGTVLFPGADDIVLMVAQNRDRLSTWFRFSHLPPDLVEAMIDKKRLYYLAKANDIPTPDTLFPRSEDEVVQFAEHASFPIMLKGIDGTRLQARTGRKMVRVDDLDSLVREYRDLEDPEQPNLMLQEFIPGGDDSVWMFNGYFDDDSECLMGFTGRKIHQHPPYKGATSLGVVLENETVYDLTLRFAKGIGYRGILDIGFRFDPRDGGYKLLDPNPRIGCTFRLFVGQDGMDVARAHYRHLTGQTVPRSAQAEGRKWLVEDWEIDSVRAYRRDGLITLGRWLMDVRGVRELAWWAWDDPVPAFRKVGHLLVRSLRRVGKRLSHKGRAGRREPGSIPSRRMSP